MTDIILRNTLNLIIFFLLKMTTGQNNLTIFSEKYPDPTEHFSVLIFHLELFKSLLSMGYILNESSAKS
ncbi:hypothetical protein BpHYR1_027492 [Brachionus plicatilis]|uniref:Uncharacterized protein n=1 Tax=Brachionus plicatilis TaxID=10195 RepID=A0A3M7RYP5_BRAPC|nr:hypothetical protein BpHYR1_027492 [Brachionus plicatilis]